MTPTGIIIQQSQFNDNFLSVCIELLGYSPAQKADAENLNGIARSLSCLVSFRQIENTKKVYDLISIGCLLVADERDITEILETTAMPFVFTETKIRGIQAAVVSGTLRQWESALLRGCNSDEQYIRICYDALYLQFRSIGLDFGKTQKYKNDNTFLLQ